MAKWGQADVHGQSALHMAAEKGNAAALRLLILRGIAVNTRDQHLKTALHLAAEFGHTQCVEILLQLGADPSLADVKGRTPAHYAALLEGKGSDAADPTVSTPLTAQAMEAVNCLRRLLVESADDLPMLVRDKMGISPFFVAVAGGSTEAARRMLEQLQETEDGVFSLSPSQFADASGWSPLHYAAFHGRLPCLQALLEAFDMEKEASEGESEWKANPMIEWQDKDGVRPLHAAAQNAQTSLMAVSLLLNHGANAHAMTNSGCTVLHVAASTGHQLLCQHLVSKCPELLKKKDRNGDSARKVAAHFGHDDLAAFLKSCSSPARRESLPPVDIPVISAATSPTSSPSGPLSPAGSPSHTRRKGVRLLVASPLARPRVSLEAVDDCDCDGAFELDLGIADTPAEPVVQMSKIRPPTPLHALKFSRLSKQLPPPRAAPSLALDSGNSTVTAPLPPPPKRAPTPVSKGISRSRLKAKSAISAPAPAPATVAATAAVTPTKGTRVHVDLPATPVQPELAVRTARGSSQRKATTATTATTTTPLSAAKRERNATNVTPMSGRQKGERQSAKSTATKKKTPVSARATAKTTPRSAMKAKTRKTPTSGQRKAKAAVSSRYAYGTTLAKKAQTIAATATAAEDVVVGSTMLSRRRAARARAAELAKEKEEKESRTDCDSERETEAERDTELESLDAPVTLPTPSLELMAAKEKSMRNGPKRTRAPIPFSEPRARRASTVAKSKKAAVKEEVSFQARVLKARGKGADATEMLRRSVKKSRNDVEEFDRRNRIDQLTSTPLASSSFRGIREAAMERQSRTVGRQSSVSRSISRSDTVSSAPLEAPATPLFSSFRKRTETKPTANSASRSASRQQSSIQSTATVTPVTSRSSSATPLTARTAPKATTQQRQRRVRATDSENAANNNGRRSAAMSARKERPATVSRSRSTATSAKQRTTAVSGSATAKRPTKSSNSVSSASVSRSAATQKRSSVVSRLMDDAAKRRARAAAYEKSAAFQPSSSCFSTPAATGRRGRRAPSSAAR